MEKPRFTINQIDIASANLGWLVAQMLLGTFVTKKLLTAKEAKEMLEFCAKKYATGPSDRAMIREAVNQCLGPLIKQYDVPPQDQQH